MSLNNPLISVIVPNFNYAAYLDERIKSILNQTFQDFELILLDDCSTDNSREILESYRDTPHVSQIVFNEQNSGSPFIQWMKGISLAKGKYIWIAEADDLAENSFLESCVSLILRTKNVSICFTGSNLIGSKNNIIKKDVNHWGRRRLKEHAIFRGEKYAQKNLYWKNYIINASGVVFSRDKALKISTHFTSMRFCGDYLFWFNMALKGDVIEIYKSLNYFRIHNKKATIASHNNGQGIIEDIEIVAYMEQLLPQLNSYRKRLRRGYLYRKISRQKMTPDIKKQLYVHLFNSIGGGHRDRFIQKTNKFAKLFNPFLPTISRDRL